MSAVDKIVGAVVGFFTSIYAAVAGFFGRANRLRKSLLPPEVIAAKLLSLLMIIAAVAVVGVVVTLYGTLTETDQFIEYGLTTVTLTGYALVGVGLLFVVVWTLERRGIIESLIVTTRLRQRTQLSTGIVAVLCGLLVTVGLVAAVRYGYELFTGVLLGVSDVPVRWWVFGLLLVALWLGLTALFGRLIGQLNDSYLRTDLTILDVANYDDTRELVVRNDSDEPIDFTKAKIVDAQRNSYVLDIRLVLRPGEDGTFELPTGFMLDRIEYEVPRGMGFMYDAERTASIYTRAGNTFVLPWEGTNSNSGDETVASLDAAGSSESV